MKRHGIDQIFRAGLIFDAVIHKPGLIFSLISESAWWERKHKEDQEPQDCFFQVLFYTGHGGFRTSFPLLFCNDIILCSFNQPQQIRYDLRDGKCEKRQKQLTPYSRAENVTKVLRFWEKQV
ncbi:MAG: hypothetical protein IIY60_06740 [Clostridia bacterium]|nr:hypothetical protein [Clostridia bacterium]